MNFIQKENFHVLKRSQYRGESPLRSNRGPRWSDGHVQFVGDDSRASSCPVRRPYSSTWVQRFAAAPRPSMAIWIFSLTRFWPMYSSSRFGARSRQCARLRHTPVRHNPFRLSLLHHPLCRSVGHCFHHKKNPQKHNTERTEVGAQSTERSRNFSCFSGPSVSKFFPCSYGRAARPSAPSRLQRARSSFSKFAVPAARFASPTAPSAAPRRIPASPAQKITSASTVRACRPPVSRPLSPQLPACPSFTTMRSAVFLRRRGFSSAAPDRSANRRDSSSTLDPAQKSSAPASGPPPKRKAASRKCFSRADTNPYSGQPHLPARVVDQKRHFGVQLASAAYVESGTCTRYRTPLTSTSTCSVFFRRAVAELASSLASIAAFLRPSTRSRKDKRDRREQQVPFFYFTVRQVRVTQTNRSGRRDAARALYEEVCSNSVRGKEKKLSKNS